MPILKCFWQTMSITNVPCWIIRSLLPYSFSIAARSSTTGINEGFELYPTKETDLSIFPERIMFRNDTEVEKFYASTSII